MLALELGLVLILLALCSFAPGFFFIRRFHWGPLEKLCGSIGLSLVLLYLASWAIFVFTKGNPAPFYVVVTVLCGLAAVLSWRDAVRLFRASRVRQGLAGYGFLLAWSLLLLSMIRNYSGAFWSDDWLEHCQRTLFFLQRFPVTTSIFPGYQLPARPPLMNVIGAFFLGQTADRFEILQFVFVALNLLLFLPCFLMLPALVKGRVRTRRWVALPLVGIFAMSPLLMENVTYTWTKALTAFFVTLAVWLYLAARRKGDTVRMVAAFLSLAAGLLAHYSAGPYVVVLALHYLFVEFRRRGWRVRELGAIVVLCSLLLATWFGWSIATYGVHTTFASNTSVTSSEKYQDSNLAKAAANLYDTVVPVLIRDPGSLEIFQQPNSLGYFRDCTFLLYQTNAIFGMGTIGGLIVLWLLLRTGISKKNSGSERSFWLLMVPCIFVLGIAVVGERDLNGVAHLTLMPLELLGLTWLAATMQRRRAIGYLILIGLVVDFGVGVFLQMRVENLENSPQHTYFTGMQFNNGRFLIGGPGPETLNRMAWGNWLSKHQVAQCQAWLNEVERHERDGSASPAGVTKTVASLRSMIDDDQRLWGGWYSRHGGEFTYFGDLFGDAWVNTGLLLAVWGALMWSLWRHLPLAVVAKPTARPARTTPKRRR